MKLSLAFSTFYACLTFGCTSHPSAVTAPSFPNALHVTVDTVHCKPTKHQPDPESGMTSLVCVGDEKSALGVLIGTGDWNALQWVAH